jgi:hypothetical protein
MTTHILPATGAVTVVGVDAASTVVGSAPQWADATDATYADVWTTEGNVDYAKAAVAQLPGPIDTSAGDGYTWARIRLQAGNTVSTTSNNTIHCELWDTATGTLITATTYGFTDGNIHTENFEFNGDDNQAVADVAAAGTLEARVWAEYATLTGSQRFGVTVFELEVRVDGADSSRCPTINLYAQLPEVLNDTPTIVGANPLGDGDDSTYIEYTTVVSVPRQATDRADQTHGRIDALPAARSALSRLTVNYRATVTTDDWQGIEDYLFLLHTEDFSVHLPLYPFPDPDRPLEGGPYTYTFEITDELLNEWGYTREALMDGLVAGMWVDAAAWRGSTTGMPDGQWTTVIRLHEFWVSVSGGCASPKAYNRILQRGNDGLGITGGRRILGTKTLQSSNRATGIR